MGYFDDKKLKKYRKLTKSQFDYLIHQLANTPRALQSVCTDLGVDTGDVYFTINNNDDLNLRYARAKAQQIQVYIDDIDVSIERVAEMVMSVEDKRVCNALVNLNKTYTDTIKWKAAKLMPKLYSDRVLADIKVEHKMDETEKDDVRIAREMYAVKSLSQDIVETVLTDTNVDITHIERIKTIEA